MLLKCCNHLAEERLSFRLVSLPSNGLDLQRHVSSAVIKRDRSFNVHPPPSFECDQHSRVIPAPFAHCNENQSINNVGDVRTEIALFPETILTQTDPATLVNGSKKSSTSSIRRCQSERLDPHRGESVRQRLRFRNGKKKKISIFHPLRSTKSTGTEVGFGERVQLYLVRSKRVHGSVCERILSMNIERIHF